MKKAEGKKAGGERRERCLLLVASGLSALAFFSACAGSKSTPASNASPTPAASSSAARPTPAPVGGVETGVEREGAGVFNQYRFTYVRRGGEVEATFAPEMLPWDDALVVAAAREVLVAAYNDRSENFPRPAVWQYRGAETRAIKLEGVTHEYVFVPLREDVGGRRVRAIAFWQLPKGTIK
jgi:hypothetical protein